MICAHPKLTIYIFLQQININLYEKFLFITYYVNNISIPRFPLCKYRGKRDESKQSEHSAAYRRVTGVRLETVFDRKRHLSKRLSDYRHQCRWYRTMEQRQNHRQQDEQHKI